MNGQKTGDCIVSICIMFRKCEHCGHRYTYNPSVGNFGVVCPKCKKIQITGNIGGLGAVIEVKIEEGEYPFHYYYKLLPQEYIFLDTEGNKIR